MSETRTPVRVAVLAIPETSASMVYAMFDMFMATGRDWGLVIDGTPGPQLVQAKIVATRREPFTVGNDVLVAPHATLDETAPPDIVCVPDLLVSPDESIDGRFAAELAWLRRCYAQGAMLATACSGARLLAQSGLLDGYDATTHWAYCDAMKCRYPAIKVHPQRALVISGEGGRLIMAGAGSSSLDLTLYLIARAVGVEEAMQVARLSLIDWHAIGQQHFARLARTRQVEDALIARCQSWIAEHYQESAPVAAMVRLSGIAERSFKRRFQQATGMPPLEYVHTLRLEEAKHMLETTEEPIEAIALDVGYEDAGFFSRLFKRTVNLTPAQYRKRFGSMRRALQTGGLPQPLVPVPHRGRHKRV